MYSRTRDIEDSGGTCLRVSISAHRNGALVTLERRDQPHRPSALLSLHGAEILNGFIMSARLSTPYPMPDEASDQPFPALFRLDTTPQARVVIEQEDRPHLSIETPLWDRLYAELCLVIAHGREQTYQQTQYNSLGVLH